MQRAPIVDFELESIRGGTRALSSLRGRFVVVFYESRDHLEDNAALKARLERLGGPRGREVVVLGVGDLRAFDFAPARAIARTAIRALASRHDLEVLLDWRGELAKAPFAAQAGGSHVFVVAPDGALVFAHRGVADARTEATILGLVTAREQAA